MVKVKPLAVMFVGSDNGLDRSSFRLKLNEPDRFFNVAVTTEPAMLASGSEIVTVTERVPFNWSPKLLKLTLGVPRVTGPKVVVPAGPAPGLPVPPELGAPMDWPRNEKP